MDSDPSAKHLNESRLTFATRLELTELTERGDSISGMHSGFRVMLEIRQTCTLQMELDDQPTWIRMRASTGSGVEAQPVAGYEPNVAALLAVEDLRKQLEDFFRHWPTATLEAATLVMPDLPLEAKRVAEAMGSAVRLLRSVGRAMRKVPRTSPLAPAFKPKWLDEPANRWARRLVGFAGVAAIVGWTLLQLISVCP